MNSPGTSVAELKEVRGPSSLGGGRRRFLDLLWLMSVTEFKRMYFGTVFGYLWSLVRPLIQFAVLLIVFTKIAKVGKGVPNYAEGLLLSIVLFGFFQEATQNSVQAVLAQEGIVRKTQFPRMVIPLAVVLTALFNLGLNLVVVFIFILAAGVDPTWTWLLFPVAMGLLLVFTATAGMLLSALYVRFRDVMIIWTVLVGVLIYATPIVFPIENVPSELRKLIMLNPLSPIFEQIRVWIIDPSAPTAAQAAGGVLNLLPSVVLFIGICVLGVWTFNRAAPRIAEEI